MSIARGSKQPGDLSACQQQQQRHTVSGQSAQHIPGKKPPLRQVIFIQIPDRLAVRHTQHPGRTAYLPGADAQQQQQQQQPRHQGLKIAALFVA